MLEPHWLPFLHFNYLPDTAPGLPFDSVPDVERPSLRFEEAATRAGELIASAVGEHVTSGKTHVIPISGGLDSRAILLAAIEQGCDVLAVSFGAPGSMDLEFGTAVARALGVPHRGIDLHACSPTTAGLVDVARSGGAWTYLLDAYFNRRVPQMVGEGPIYLTGFMGDPIAGSKLGIVPQSVPAIEYYAKKERYTRSMSLLPPHVHPPDVMPPWSPPLEAGVTRLEALDFSLRQRSAIQPIVMPAGYDYRAPFTEPRLVRFMLSLPREWRLHCRLYEEALFNRWPDAFSMATKNHYGQGLQSGVARRRMAKAWHLVRDRWARRAGGRRVRPLENYIDLASAFAESAHWRDLLRENLRDLDRRAVTPWLRAERLLEDHIDRGQRLAKELHVLLGLEINLKALAQG